MITFNKKTIDKVRRDFFYAFYSFHNFSYI